MTTEEKKLAVYDLDRQLEALQVQAHQLQARANTLLLEKQKLLEQIIEDENKKPDKTPGQLDKRTPEP